MEQEGNISACINRGGSVENIKDFVSSMPSKPMAHLEGMREYATFMNGWTLDTSKSATPGVPQLSFDASNVAPDLDDDDEVDV